DFKKAVNEAGFKNDVGFLRFISNLNNVLSEDAVVSSRQTIVSKPEERTFEDMANEAYPQYANK
ncbi:MAG: hypothetical protein KAR42_18240, partial [candidate division Zixibacteria bacterium]|nr:hypothetical protein [candidate division Zixibacteria bacterium]